MADILNPLLPFKKKSGLHRVIISDSEDEQPIQTESNDLIQSFSDGTENFSSLDKPMNKMNSFVNSDIFDTEEDAEEMNKESPEKILSASMKRALSKGAAKKTNSKSNDKAKSKENLTHLHSETQRIIRESSVNIPYYQPEKPSLDAILANAKSKQQSLFTSIKNLPKSKVSANNLLAKNEPTKSITNFAGIGKNLDFHFNKENSNNIADDDAVDIPNLQTRLLLQQYNRDGSKVEDCSSVNVNNNDLSMSKDVFSNCLLKTPLNETNSSDEQPNRLHSTIVKNLFTSPSISSLDSAIIITKSSLELCDIVPNFEQNLTKSTSLSHNLSSSNKSLETMPIDINSIEKCNLEAESICLIPEDKNKTLALNNKKSKPYKNFILPTLSNLTPSLSSSSGFVDLDERNEETHEVTKFQDRLFKHVGNVKKSSNQEVTMNTVTMEKVDNGQELKLDHFIYKFDDVEDTPGARLVSLRDKLQEKMREQRENKLKKRYEMYEKIVGNQTADRMEEDAPEVEEDVDSEDEDLQSDDEELDSDDDNDIEEDAIKKQNPFVDEEAEDDDDDDEDYQAVDDELEDDANEYNSDENENKSEHNDPNYKDFIDSKHDDDDDDDEELLHDKQFDKLNDAELFDTDEILNRQSSLLSAQKQTPLGSKESSFEWNTEYSCSLIPAGQPSRSKLVSTPNDLYPESSNAISGHESKCSEDVNDSAFQRTQLDAMSTSFEKNHSILETSINTQNPEFEWLLGKGRKEKDIAKNSLNNLDLSQCANDDILMLCSGKFSSQEIIFAQPSPTQSKDFPCSTLNFNSISLKRKLDDDDEDDNFQISSCGTSAKRRPVFDDFDVLVPVNHNNVDYEENQENVDDEESCDEEIIDDDDDLIGSTEGIRGKNGKINKNFLDEEAELSGSDKGEDDDDVDSEDELELEEGDADEVGTEEDLKDQVHRIHLKSIIDEDKRQLMLLQEQYLPDGDLHSEAGGRMKRFRWNTKEIAEPEEANEFTEFLEKHSASQDADDESQWRMERKEREEFLASLNMDDSTTTGFFSTNFSTTSSNTSFNEKSNSLTVGGSFKIPMLNRTGSFLGRNRDSLTKISDCVKTGVNLNPKNSKNFVFMAISSPEKKRRDKIYNKGPSIPKIIKNQQIGFSNSSKLLRLLNQDSLSNN